MTRRLRAMAQARSTNPRPAAAAELPWSRVYDLRSRISLVVAKVF